MRRNPGQIPGVHFPPGETPDLFLDVNHYSQMQSDYLDSCESYYTDPTSEHAGRIKQSSSRTISSFRKVVRAIINSEPNSLEETLDAIQGFVVVEDTKRINFFRGLTRTDIFPFTAPYAEEFGGWLSQEYGSSTSEEEFEDKVVDMAVTLFNGDGRILARHVAASPED
jgi:hypothetical protein